ncbi:MAG TPA: hypothetical protein VM658_06620 [bacterium]|nr:hypothetical protein [bacterium]
MRKAEARSGSVAAIPPNSLIQELSHLYRTLPPENYFQAVEDFIDQARLRLGAVPDPEERERLREEYREAVNFAMDLACGITQ